MSGVGTELSKLIPDWALQFKGGCSCRDTAKKWDTYGIPWCERNREALINHLMSQEKHLSSVFKLVPETLKRIAAGKLIDRAIKAAKDSG